MQKGILNRKTCLALLLAGSSILGSLGRTDRPGDGSVLGALRAGPPRPHRAADPPPGRVKEDSERIPVAAGADPPRGRMQENTSQLPVAAADSEVRFGRDVRPILSDRCFQCHGPDSRTREADVRFDLPPQPGDAWEDLLSADDPAHSELLRRISSGDPDEMMPPPHSNKPPLSPAEQLVMRRWIEQGATYESHWSFVPPTRPELPSVQHAAWCLNPIDRFILARLEQEGVNPSPPADRAALVRRLFLDLTGLPPTPEEASKFIADPDPMAYEKLVDRLLSEEPYCTRVAEHAAVRWLDGARYADTNGIHTDAGRQMWLWRDWVLNAYRQNMPFDQFIREQMAGDLLPDATIEQKIASGFNRNHVITDEGGAIDQEYLVEYAVDRTTTTGSLLLGLTLVCARCHEHKFDPITQEDFYGLYAFFNSNEEPGLYSQQPNSNRAFEPFLAVPTADQQAELDRLAHEITTLQDQLDRPDPQETASRDKFVREVQAQAHWSDSKTLVQSAVSRDGAKLAIQPDQSILASGENPPTDVHTLTLRLEGDGWNLLALEGLPDASLPEGRVGRAGNGNAVLSDVTAEAVSVADPTQRVPVQFRWAWANVQQRNGDYSVLNAIDGDPQTGWAVAGHEIPGPRVALFLTEQPMGFEGGTDLVVQLKYETIHQRHVLGRVRLSVGQLAEDSRTHLPAIVSDWYRLGPFEAAAGMDLYKTVIGPEQHAALDRQTPFGPKELRWQVDVNLRDETPNALDDGTNVILLGRRIHAPRAMRLPISLGSDDGFELFVHGQSVAKREVQRAVAPDQDQVEVELQPGANWLVLKAINTGGASGFYFRALPTEPEWPEDLLAALAPPTHQSPEVLERIHHAWRLHFSPGYRATQAQIAELQAKEKEVQQSTPLTMVMKELAETRQAYVLMRGAYDKPDTDRPVERSIPKALGMWPEGLPRNRLGLADWLVSPGNPLVSRVAVNRTWEQFFGTGIVETSEDFGSQGQWPSHPDLLDWLAVEFREQGWDMHHLIRLIVTSQTYRQASTIRPEVRERDPQNRWLSWFPRRRLTAEQIRDQALYVAGLLVEKMGGPSVKPYQPEGIWAEVAMPASNTRTYQQGEGEALWRRSLYTYWKRACPPPSLMTFDAPTRESCTIRRGATNTPLQALVLWNDPQFVEASRELATRALHESNDDSKRIAAMFQRVLVRAPEALELEKLSAALAKFRQVYAADQPQAAELLKVGAAPADNDLSASELAAWTMLANAVLNLSETVTVQ